MKTRLTDVFLYIGIGILVLVAIVLSSLNHISVSRKWSSFTFFTGLLAVALVKMYWSARKDARLWFLLAAVLGLHCAFYVALLDRIGDWPAFSYVISCPLEAMLTILIVKLCLNIMPVRGWNNKF